MSDWEVVQNTALASPAPSMNASNSDWEVVNTPPSMEPQPNESEGMALLKAPYRVGEDLYRRAANAVTSIPDYWNKAQTEIPGAYNDITQHPGHALSQFAAGLTQAGHGLLNAPHNLADYEANRLNLIPKAVANNVPSQDDINPEINSYFGAPNQAGDQLLQGTGRNLSGILGAADLAATFNPLKLLASQKGIKNALLSSHDALENDASQAFKTVSDQVNGRGINKLPIDQPQTIKQRVPNKDNISFNNFWDTSLPTTKTQTLTIPPPETLAGGANLNTTFINSLRPYFANTAKTSNLLNDAATGDYNALRQLQSDLYTKGKLNLASDLNATKNEGEEMMEKRNDINQAISNHLKNTGNYDLDHLLTGARNDWSTLQQNYYNKNIPGSLIEMFDSNVRKIPNNLTSILSENSKPMQKLRDFHPGIQNKVNAINTRNKLGKYGLGATGLGAGGAWLYHQMFGTEQPH